MKLEEILVDESLKSIAASAFAALLIGCAVTPSTSPPPEYIQAKAGTEQTHDINTALWKRFCATYSGECDVKVTNQKVIPYSVARDVNHEMNKSIRPDLDIHKTRINYSVGEKGYGNCVDYALAKRNALRKLGYSQESMTLATVRADTLHMVLIVKTSNGDLLLDNLHDEPVKLSNTYKQLIGIEINGKWYDVEHDAKP